MTLADLNFENFKLILKVIRMKEDDSVEKLTERFSRFLINPSNMQLYYIGNIINQLALKHEDEAKDLYESMNRSALEYDENGKQSVTKLLNPNIEIDSVEMLYESALQYSKLSDNPLQMNVFKQQITAKTLDEFTGAPKPYTIARTLYLKDPKRLLELDDFKEYEKLLQKCDLTREESYKILGYVLRYIDKKSPEEYSHFLNDFKIRLKNAATTDNELATEFKETLKRVSH